MIKVSDYIAKRLAEVYNVRHVFLISGGGAMHLNDAFGKQVGIDYICNHHEQASAIAAEGYARYKQELAVVNVTTGPGGINALNGVFGQWTDSAPVLYISGQVKYETTLAAFPEIQLRQLGDQEVDIITIVKPITKYAKMITEPQDIKYILDKAVYLATTGRKGPVWIDVPINIQGALINEDELKNFLPDTVKTEDKELNQISEVVAMIAKSKRPLIVAGHGIRLSKSENNFYDLLKLLHVPVVTTFNGFDILDDNHPNFIGRIGTVGQRSGNFALQNADLVLFLGTRNNIRQVSYNWEFYARNAKKIIVDIDPAELIKPTLKPDLAICADLKDFIPLLSSKLKALEDFSLIYQNWIDWCKVRKEKYAPHNNPLYVNKSSNLINPYFFIQKLTHMMKEGDLAVAGNGSACVCLFQAGTVKTNQRIFWNSGDASMGYDLPAAIGLCIAANKQSTVCLAGDGSLMMNLQELQTIRHYNLPVKLIIMNNDGYISIKQTQTNFFEGRLTGSDKNSGVSVPNFTQLASAFGIPSIRIHSVEDLETKLPGVLSHEGPIVCEVMLDSDYIFAPKLSSEKLPDGRMVSKPLEDMYPFLDRAEFAENIIKNDI